MYKYEIIIYWSQEDDVFVAEVPELLGCAAHGDNPATALANAQQAIELWIETAKEFGDPVPEPKGRHQQIGVSQEAFEHLLAELEQPVTVLPVLVEQLAKGKG